MNSGTIASSPIADARTAPLSPGYPILHTPPHISRIGNETRIPNDPAYKRIKIKRRYFTCGVFRWCACRRSTHEFNDTRGAKETWQPSHKTNQYFPIPSFFFSLFRSLERRPALSLCKLSLPSSVRLSNRKTGTGPPLRTHLAYNHLPSPPKAYSTSTFFRNTPACR